MRSTPNQCLPDPQQQQEDQKSHQRDRNGAKADTTTVTEARVPDWEPGAPVAMAELVDTDAPTIDRMLSLNVNVVIKNVHAVLPHMIERGYGRIVNIASVAGKEGNPNAPAYSAAKAGLIGLTKSLGKELATSGVLCNCVTPAAAETDIFKQMTEAHIAFMKSKIPMNRFVQVEEIAAMVAWLASEDCSFTTGGVFDISGGRATY